MCRLALLSVSTCLIISVFTVDVHNTTTTVTTEEQRNANDDYSPKQTWINLSDEEKLAVRLEVAEVIGEAMDKGILLGEDSYGNEYYLIYDHVDNKAVVTMVTGDGEMYPLSAPVKMEEEEEGEGEEQKGVTTNDEIEKAVDGSAPKKSSVKFDWNIGECHLRRLRRKRQVSWRVGNGRQGIGLYGRYRNGGAYLTGRTNFRNRFNVRAGASYRTRHGTFRVGGSYGGTFGSGGYRSNYGVRVSYTFG